MSACTPSEDHRKPSQHQSAGATDDSISAARTSIRNCQDQPTVDRGDEASQHCNDRGGETIRGASERHPTGNHARQRYRSDNAGPGSPSRHSVHRCGGWL